MSLRRSMQVCVAVMPGLTCSALAQTETPVWSQTLDRISSGVVSLKVDATRAFDTGLNTSGQATGFVVDAEQGLILTNRHVVTPGPVRAEALFLNQEEVELTAVYRDPVHDFGLFRYDPQDLNYLQPAELSLRPDKASVGVEVRVVGNDAGEQLSILSGTIARLDRRAPTYGFGLYNDFNTDYIQAASGSSGGSSGSPVVDIRGHVIALNAGASSSAASSFFLPLDRVKRAVELLQAGEPVTRGTLQAKFIRVAYDELDRLGLREETEVQFRRLFPDRTGMLVVSSVMRGGPADGSLEVGDILVGIGAAELADFVALEALLDDSVGQTIDVRIERNGEALTRVVTVADLHAITPAEYIEFGDSVVHDLSYQQGWHFNRPRAGVFIAAPGYVFRAAGIPRKSLIVEVEGEPVRNLDEMERALAKLADRQEAAVRYVTLEQPTETKLRLVRMDRRWFRAARCANDPATGLWPCRLLEPGPEPASREPVTAKFVTTEDRQLRRIAQSLVLVNFDMPYTISGVSDRHYYGTGIVVDAERGYVVVDRNTVPEAMGDARITFAGSVEIPARVEFVHPLHNLTLLSYEPSLLGDTPVESARLNMTEPRAGDELRVVGLRPDSRLASQAARVASVDPLSLPLSRTMRFRDTNLDVISLVNYPRDFDGALLDKSGAVTGLWSSFAFDTGKDVSQRNYGVPVELVAEMLALVSEGKRLHSLEAELQQLPLSVARRFGLPEDWTSRLSIHDTERRQLLVVNRTVAGSPAARLLKSGDMLLAIDGELVTRFREVERAAQKDFVEVTIWRDRAEQTIRIETVKLDGSGVQRAVMWSGALLQAPYRQMAAQRGIEPYGVYVAYQTYGSPASRYDVPAGARIVSVDGVAVPDLDSFLGIIRDKRDREPVRLDIVSLTDSRSVITLKIDQVYWPTAEIRHDNAWRSRLIGEDASIATGPADCSAAPGRGQASEPASATC
jgi:S1-C subfamily serine protease